jgi:hypothetical protein
MAKAGGQKGNTNASSKNPRIWADAINKALCQSQEGKPQKLRALAEKIIEKGLEGDMQAIKEIGDRVDGKALASIEVKGDISLSDMTVEALNVRLQELRDAASED